MIDSFRIRRPWLWLPSSFAHDVFPIALKVGAKFRSYQTYSWQSFDWRGLHFANPLGIAAGLDKNATQIKDWWTYGPGFIEIGTVVPHPQLPNSGPILSRNTQQRAIWNRMGFPSRGMEYVKQQLMELGENKHTPLFINIGKNRDTKLEVAHKDYCELIHHLDFFADTFVINISSPNTQGLRQLLTRGWFQDFLGPIIEKRNSIGNTPLLVKLSPDLDEQALRFCLETSLEMGIDGWVLTNTTLARKPNIVFPKEGGVSGAPLRELSLQMLKNSISILGDKKKDHLLVSVGGVLSPEDVLERIEFGADLVQSYAALVFEGPGFFKNVHRFVRS